MEQSKLNKLKIAAEQFYLNRHLDQPLISDEEYDALIKEFRSEGNTLNDLIGGGDLIEIQNIPEDPLDKIIVKDNRFDVAIEQFVKDNNILDYYLNLKYDGGAIKIIYNEKGQLVQIVSTPDEKLGVIRTAQFKDLVPSQINPKLGIQCIRGEVLVDPAAYGLLARNKANGLINSTVSVDEIKHECFIRWYKLTYFDGQWNWGRQWTDLTNIPEIKLNRTRKGHDLEVRDKVFSYATPFGTDEVPNNPIKGFKCEDEPDDDEMPFQCDGVVLYSDECIQGFKFYYTDSAITTVKDVIWNRQSNGSFAAVLQLGPIELDEKLIQKASSNGVPKMIKDHCGVGAVVKVILANTTIPKVIEVLKPSDNFNFPKCECGYQLSEKDIYGSTLKCGNTGICSAKVKAWLPEVADWIVTDDLFKDKTTLEECILAEPWWFGYVLHIDRWEPNQEMFTEHEWHLIGQNLLQAISNSDKKLFDEEFDRMFELTTDLQFAIYNVNLASAVEVLHKLLEINDLKEIQNKILNNDY